MMFDRAKKEGTEFDGKLFAFCFIGLFFLCIWKYDLYCFDKFWDDISALVIMTFVEFIATVIMNKWYWCEYIFSFSLF